MNRSIDIQPAVERQIIGTFVVDSNGIPFEGQLTLVEDRVSGPTSSGAESHRYFMDGMGVRFQFDPSLIDGCTGFAPSSMVTEGFPMQIILPPDYIPSVE